jgi:hypothetical protein
MARRDENPTGQAEESGSGPWLASYSARLAQTAEDTMRVGAAAADRWARRSLEDGEWSVDSVTADVIADWEEMTPLLGRWLDLWLEAVQRGIRAGDRAVPAGGDDAGGQVPDPSRLVARRVREYGELWEGAEDKLRDSSYRSEDLLDDWFRLWGKAVRDLTAGSALLWGAASGRAPEGGGQRNDGRAQGTAER